MAPPPSRKPNCVDIRCAWWAPCGPSLETSPLWHAVAPLTLQRWHWEMPQRHKLPSSCALVPCSARTPSPVLLVHRAPQPACWHQTAIEGGWRGPQLPPWTQPPWWIDLNDEGTQTVWYALFLSINCPHALWSLYRRYWVFFFQQALFYSPSLFYYSYYMCVIEFRKLYDSSSVSVLSRPWHI